MNDDTRQVGAIAVSIVVTLGFFGVLALLITRSVQTNPLLDGVVGALITSFSGVVYYWTGSTSGSQQKDRHIADLMNKMGPPGP